MIRNLYQRILHQRTLFLSFVGILGLLNASQAEAPSKISLSLSNQQAERLARIREEVFADLWPSKEVGQGMGYFSLKDGPKNLRLSIPRAYMTFKPNRLNGETDSLKLALYLPGLQPRQEMIETIKEEVLNFGKISLFILPQSHYLQYWGDQHLGPRFSVFQSRIDTFQSRFPSDDPAWKACMAEEVEPSSKACLRLLWPTRCLKNGQPDSVTGWTVYEGLDKVEVGVNLDAFDKIYLKPGANPCHPGEWLECSGHHCKYYRFRDGITVEISFHHKLLPCHRRILEKIDYKLDEFMGLLRVKSNLSACSVSDELACFKTN